MTAPLAIADERTALRGRARSILRGPSGRLFYEEYEGASIAALAAREPFPSPLALRWQRTLETRARRLKRRGLVLHILLGPDAHSIYRDQLPAAVNLPPASLSAQFLARFAGMDNVVFVNPEQALIDARGGIDVCKANDTHWSAYGAFLAYRQLMAMLPADPARRALAARDIAFRFRRSFGDMGALVEPELAIEVPVPTIDGRDIRPAFNHVGAARDSWVRYDCAQGAGRALVPRDSFATELAPFLNATFARVDWISAPQSLPFEVVDQERPDVLVWETAERRLPFPPRDHLPFGAYETYAFDVVSEPGRLALAAQIDRQEGAVVRALENAQQGALADPGNPVHHFWLGQILMEAGRHTEAEAAVQTAIGLRDDRPAYWHLLNIILRHLGRPADSLEAATRAVALFPDNALFVSHLGYNLLAAGQLHRAIDAMRACRDAVSDSEELCHWLARAHLAAGDRAAALAAAADCFLLQPDHPQVHWLLAQIRQ